MRIDLECINCNCEYVIEREHDIHLEEEFECPQCGAVAAMKSTRWWYLFHTGAVESLRRQICPASTIRL